MADTTEHPPGQGEGPAPRRGVPVWAWVGGTVLVGLLIMGVVGVIIAVLLPGPFATVLTATDCRSAGIPEAACTGVKINSAWTPYIQEFNGVQMALVPAGCFRMGSEDSEHYDEYPAHEVCFEEPFWIDVYEVTNEAFGSAGCESSSSMPEQPRVCIDWFDSAAYCESRGARLPTEAEWEYAARGPDGLVYPWGNDFIADNVIYYGNSGRRTWDVGSKPGGVSWIGAFDLSGNVWEWVHDWYDSGYYGTLADGVVNPQGPGTGDIRVLRGGSWVNDSNIVHATYRGKFNPSLDSDSLGFRCARSYIREEGAAKEPSEEIAAEEPTVTPTDTPTPTNTPIPLGTPSNPVISNDQWVPVIQKFDGVEMALVPAGCFQMGSGDFFDAERPVHEVCFGAPFWIDVYEVTNGQVGEAACTDYSSEDDQPRVCINWFDSLAHCEARGARLPTEAEWEYAARGPDSLIYPWGNSFDGTLLNYCDKNCARDWADTGVDDGHQYTSPVGVYPDGVSWIGAFDLSGNVSEWVNDWLDAAYYSTLADGVVNPQGPGSGEFRATRGGSWYAYSNYVRAAYRFWFDPSLKLSYFGFRCARSYSP